MHGRERILNLNSAENKGGGGGGGESLNGNLRGEMEKAEGDERRRGEKSGEKIARGRQEKPSGREQETETSKRAQNEKMIRFT